MLARLFTLAILAVIGYFTFKSYFTAPRRPASRPRPRPNSADDSEEMVICAGCGIYISAQTALAEPGAESPRYFCSEACRQRQSERS